MLRRAVAMLAFAAIVAGGFETFYLRVLTFDTRLLSASLRELPWRKTPGLRAFLYEVRARTPAGARIAIALPFTTWLGGYEYGYVRSAFLLPGRQIVPLLSAPQNVAQCDYIAAWHCQPRVPGFVAVWRTPDGVLLRREDAAVLRGSG